MNGLVRVVPVIDHSVRGLCFRPYPLHPKGCPNANKCDRCPPKAPLFENVFDLGSPVFAVVNEFDIGSHVERMRAAHPDWTDRQLYCVLYWQPKARKALAAKVKESLKALPGYVETRCPEAMGIDVTKTLANAGVVLEWPPLKIARQVSFLGRPI
jgi:hypothetical protein